MTMMNMAGMNQAAMGGGQAGGGMMMMNNNGSPAMQVNSSSSPEQVKVQLNTYIYEYLLKLGHYDIARSLLREEKFELRVKPSVKQSPGRRKDAEVNGVDGDAMDADVKDDIPDDLPRPVHVGDASTPGIGFLYEWFSIFSDLFTAHQRSSKMQGSQAGNMGPAAQYLMQHQNMQRMRENQQNQNLARPGMMPNQFAMRNMRNNMMNGNLPRDMANKMTPQQVQQFKQSQMLQQQQQNMQREQGDVDMNGRASSPTEGENGGSPSKRPRLDGQQFNGGMMPNMRPGMPNVAPQNMMIQNAFNPNMNNAQFRQNGAMPQKPMQGGMANGMMNMGNAGSPMMQGMNPAQFGDNMQMEMYNQRMGGQQMQGTPGGGQSGNHALQDYQMQLMLLEQQNKKRLMMARAEQDNAANRDGAPMVGMQPGGMSPSGSRTGTSPNPADQMKRTPQLGGMPGSPSAAEAMAGRSPAGGMSFMNGMPTSDFNPAMFMKENQGMVGPGGPNMRPPTSVNMQQAMARQQQMGGQFQGGQPMVQQPSQGQPQPMGTPGQRTEMPPPQAPAGNNAQRNQPSSPQSGNAPPTPSTTNKPNPKKKAKEDTNKKRPAKKNSTANAPSSENEPPPTPTPSTPITPVHPQGFNSAGKAAGPGMPNSNQAPPPNQAMPPSQPQMHQPDLSQPNAFSDFGGGGPENFNLDFSTLENSDVLENFDFDSFLNTTNDDTFNFDAPIGVGGDFGLDATGE
ncbi:uncharacterized protein Z518_04415 [Rhinocladiella mackenziei CBS 650.93]|uniref:LisH domain-containing protein n=1 Tax=Rhinocladiella mackenziei CBS 650.93 TaxID=1442369 RepID=A0A0D2IL58_9EURO|nr:uncharacterized protein Z518_04415 [Rhinocladiella mackenziei CBS 650.93]KIX06439.1 hypothetical protein Z518_04415 [Rhinocladiella mackenziei CBS 650.93]